MRRTIWNLIVLRDRSGWFQLSVKWREWFFCQAHQFCQGHVKFITWSKWFDQISWLIFMPMLIGIAIQKSINGPEISQGLQILRNCTTFLIGKLCSGDLKKKYCMICLQKSGKGLWFRLIIWLRDQLLIPSKEHLVPLLVAELLKQSLKEGLKFSRSVVKSTRVVSWKKCPEIYKHL